MKRADASGARVAVIIGDTEAAAGEVSVREVVRQAGVSAAGKATDQRGPRQAEGAKRASIQERLRLELLPDAIRTILKESGENP